MQQEIIEKCTQCDLSHSDDAHNFAMVDEMDDSALFDALANHVIEKCKIKFSYDAAGKVSHVVLTKANFDQWLNMHSIHLRSALTMDSVMERIKKEEQEEAQSETQRLL